MNIEASACIGSGQAASVPQKAKDDVGLIRTDAPEGSRFRVYRVNHSATTPLNVDCLV
ncbi:hypothetical protein LX32DRAFT_40365 [Colletotrichum zoysiae]|uniref:Uncharacterized protein n=1 Tax=Colletotrichum zoysiae TaxID=1216348 RepID=A0AAD9HDE5_9PEZI|nr:hypothetical protein LX32DRAFT_40365 [Colletotrichum zoysiae]